MRTLAPLGFEARKALQAIAAGLRQARLRRRDTIAVAAARVGVSASTWQRLESGDESVAWGIVMSALMVYGFERQVFALGSPAADEQGQILEAKLLPKRGRRRKAAGAQEKEK